MSKIVNLYFSRIKSCRTVFPDGSEAAFIDGKYVTDDPDKIAYLNYEISKGHPHIFTDPAQLQIDEKFLDPMEVLKQKIIADALAAGEIKLTENSSYEAPALMPASSANLVDVKSPEELAAAALSAQVAESTPLIADPAAALQAAIAANK